MYNASLISAPGQGEGSGGEVGRDWRGGGRGGGGVTHLYFMTEQSSEQNTSGFVMGAKQLKQQGVRGGPGKM